MLFTPVNFYKSVNFVVKLNDDLIRYIMILDVLSLNVILLNGKRKKIERNIRFVRRIVPVKLLENYST